MKNKKWTYTWSTFFKKNFANSVHDETLDYKGDEPKYHCQGEAVEHSEQNSVDIPVHLRTRKIQLSCNDKSIDSS